MLATCLIQTPMKPHWMHSQNHQTVRKLHLVLPLRVIFPVNKINSIRLSVIIWNLTQANKKQHMDICSSDATTGMQGGGRRGGKGRVDLNGRKEGRRDGEWWGISPQLNQLLGCFPVLTRQSSGISKSWPLLSRAASRLTPLFWKKRPQLEAGRPGSDSCCSPLPCRRVRWLPARHSSAATSPFPLLTPFNKINARHLCGKAALLWKEFYFPNSKACATRSVGNVCSNNRKFVMFPLCGARMSKPAACADAQIFTHVDSLPLCHINELKYLCKASS